MNIYLFDSANATTLPIVSQELEDAGFTGILLPYGSSLGDYFTFIARAMDTSHKLKYIVAIRPYTISPQYLASIVKSLNEIDDDRVWINFVAGTINDYEQSLGGIMGDVNDSSHFLERKQYLIDYVPVFIEYCKNIMKPPAICVSGMSDEIFNLTENYADYNMTSYDKHIHENRFKKISKPKIITMCPFIRSTLKEINLLKNQGNIPQDAVFADSDGLVDILNSLKIDGINDVMFHVNGSDEEYSRIVEFVKNNKHLIA